MYTLMKNNCKIRRNCQKYQFYFCIRITNVLDESVRELLSLNCLISSFCFCILINNRQIQITHRKAIEYPFQSAAFGRACTEAVPLLPCG